MYEPSKQGAAHKHVPAKNSGKDIESGDDQPKELSLGMATGLRRERVRYSRTLGGLQTVDNEIGVRKQKLSICL